MFECEKIWRICGGDVLFPHFPAIPDTLFSRKIPKIFPFLGEIHSKPTINDTKTWVKYRFGHRIGDIIGEWVFAILGINQSPLLENPKGHGGTLLFHAAGDTI